MASNGRWDERVEIGPGTRWFWDPLTVQHMSRYLLADRVLPGGVIIDVACGTGFGTARLARPGRDVVGIDISADAIEFAQKYYGRDRVRFVAADATELPLPDSSVDGVSSFETIEHLTEPDAFLSELARVLRRGGRLVLSTPERRVYSRGRTDGTSANPFHPSEMTQDELLTALRPQFRIGKLLGQTSSPDRTGDDRIRGSSLRDGGRAALRRIVVATTNPLVGRGWIAERLVGILRRNHVPRAYHGEPFSYIVVVAERL